MVTSLGWFFDCIPNIRIHATYVYTYFTLLNLDNLKTKIPRVTDEGWNSQKQLSGPVEQKMKEKTLVISFKALSKFIGFFTE